MILFSFRTLALAWTCLTGAAAVGAGALQASYVPPPAVAAPEPAASILTPATPVMQAALPFENRSLLAMLPPPRPAAMPAAPLPVPPIPPARVAHAEPRHPVQGRSYGTDPAYAAAPSDPGWGWDRRLPYPGQYASGQAPYWGGQPYAYGWPPQF